MNGCDVETAAERRWDFVADPPTRLLAELNLARARMCRSEWREARRAAVRLLRHLDADSTSAMPALMPARRAELRADGLAVEAVTATLLERKEASEVLNDSVVAYEQLLGQAGSLRPSGLAGYGMVLALASRPRDAVDPLVHAAEAGQDVLMELVLRVADQLLSHGERTSAIRLLRAVRERYPDEPQLAAALADAYHQDGQDQATAAADVDAGSLLAEMGQFDNARDHFDLAMQAVPDHPRAVLGHCQALVAVGRTEEALARVGELQRSQPLLAGAWVVGALATLELGRPADALEIVDQALAQFSDDLWLLDARAHVLVALGRHREAIEAVDMALAVDPTDRLWRGLRAELSIVVDEAVDASLQILRELAAATPTAAQPSARLIRALRATGHPQQALEVVGTAQRAQPDNIGLLVPEVELLREVGRAEDAVDKAGQALERGVAHELLGLPLAHALLDAGDAVAAQRIVEAAMVDSRRAHAILGLAHLAVGEPERAVPELELAIGDPAWSPRVDVALAECLVVLGRAAQSDDLDGAIERFERAVALDPASLSACQSAAEAYRVRGDFVEALEHANAGLDLDSQDGWLIGTRGQILEAMGGKEDEAEDDLRRAITLNPELHWARVELGDLLRARNRLPEAIEVLREAVEVMPDDPWPLASLGAAEYSLDDYDAALESLSHALRLAPDYAWAHAVLSAVHADIDQLDEAHRHIAGPRSSLPRWRSHGATSGGSSCSTCSPATTGLRIGRPPAGRSTPTVRLASWARRSRTMCCTPRRASPRRSTTTRRRCSKRSLRAPEPRSAPMRRSWPRWAGLSCGSATMTTPSMPSCPRSHWIRRTSAPRSTSRSPCCAPKAANPSRWTSTDGCSASWHRSGTRDGDGRCCESRIATSARCRSTSWRREAVSSMRCGPCCEIEEVMRMSSTVPARFACPEHHTDLTDRVIAEVEDVGLVIPGSGMRLRRHSGAGAFKVAVRCPAGDGHDVVCRGTYRAGA